MRVRISLYGCGFVFFSLFLAGCGGNSTGPVSTQPTGPVSPSVVVTPASTSLSNTQSAIVNVSVGTSSNIVSGTVVLSSGSFASFPATLSNGQASITVPAGVLPVGNETLTAAYTPASSSSNLYNSASGSATIAITASSSAQPQVSTTQAFYPTAGNPFKAIPLNNGQVLVSVGGAATGIQVFSPSGSGLASTCVNSLATNLLSQNATAFGMATFNAGANTALAIGNPGVDFFTTSNLTACHATGTGYYIPQGPLSASEGTINVAITPDGQYAFVANEYGVANDRVLRLSGVVQRLQKLPEL